ncbi:MAG: hypothetical protein MK165_05555 [Pirellulaceae bacterium]|nr:hypothetical protein [Pirellulaceae bacterium]
MKLENGGRFYGEIEPKSFDWNSTSVLQPTDRRTHLLANQSLTVNFPRVF